MRSARQYYKADVTATAAFDHRHVGRFAPSPTGLLHFGSLVTALGSFIQARHVGGEWLIRIEDLDQAREQAGAAEHQLRTLASFGLVSDRPVLWQSRQLATYQAAIDTLLTSRAAFHCGCSRRELNEQGVYPGTCRDGIPSGRPARALRFRVEATDIDFVDALHGPQRQRPAEQCGDFVIRRADGVIAYQLAVVVDDAAAGITQVVRGSDLIDSTARQIMLQRALGLPTPDYLHLPLIVDAGGHKLSKSRADDPVCRHAPATALRLALRALGHEPPLGLRMVDSQLQWAIAHWDLARIPCGPIAVDVQSSDSGDYTQTVDSATSI